MVLNSTMFEVSMLHINVTFNINGTAVKYTLLRGDARTFCLKGSVAFLY
jgi:hypothetical protein